MRHLTGVVGLLGVVMPLTALGCEPIVPLAKLLGSPTAIGPLFYIQSAVWLLVAIALKCAAFVFFERPALVVSGCGLHALG